MCSLCPMWGSSNAWNVNRNGNLNNNSVDNTNNGVRPDSFYNCDLLY